MDATIEQRSHNQRTKSSILTLLLFLIILFGLILPIFSYQVPPPEKEGVLVSFGETRSGSSTENAETESEEEAVTSVSESEVEDQNEQPKESNQTPAAPPKVLTSDEKQTVNINQSEEDKKKREAEQKRLEDEARERARAEAERKEKERQEAYNSSKKQFGELLNQGDKDNNETSGNQGDPTGDPDRDALTGISKGNGRIGGGLANRGVVYEPTITDNSQKSGKIVMRVCVNAQGLVTESTFTQLGSTTVDGELRQKAKQAADNYRFTASEIEEQCGTITFEFILE